MLCLDVAVVAQMKQCPVVAVATQNHVTTTTTIASVGTSLGQILGAMHVG